MYLNETKKLTSPSTSVLPMVRFYLRPQWGKLNLGNVSPGRGPRRRGKGSEAQPGVEPVLRAVPGGRPRGRGQRGGRGEAPQSPEGRVKASRVSSPSAPTDERLRVGPCSGGRPVLAIRAFPADARVGTERRSVIRKAPEFPALFRARHAPSSLLTNGPDASLLLRCIPLRSMGTGEHTENAAPRNLPF